MALGLLKALAGGREGLWLRTSCAALEFSGTCGHCDPLSVASPFRPGVGPVGAGGAGGGDRRAADHVRDVAGARPMWSARDCGPSCRRGRIQGVGVDGLPVSVDRRPSLHLIARATRAADGGGGGDAAADVAITRDQFRRFVAGPLARQPELRAIGWTPRVVSTADRDAYERAARARDWPGSGSSN